MHADLWDLVSSTQKFHSGLSPAATIVDVVTNTLRLSGAQSSVEIADVTSEDKAPRTAATKLSLIIIRLDRWFYDKRGHGQTNSMIGFVPE